MTPAWSTAHGPHWSEAGVCFRLWAPSARSVSLLLNNEPSKPMQAVAGGWFEFVGADVKAGDLYRFQIDGKAKVPDPASRFQPHGVNGPSQLVSSSNFKWTDQNWQTLAWEDAVIYELHVGTFSAAGTYEGIEAKLDHFVELGITALELMPIASFEGERGWGYDGVLPYAAHAPYGTPETLKHLINAAHARGLMVFLDVVYNHFGPAGNYLNEYAKPFFTDHYATPWGSAINVEGHQAVRDFFIDNALFWLREYHIDGLRFDAVHAIFDNSTPHILDELAEKVRYAHPGRHLILENDKNEAHFLPYAGGQASHFTAQWNDDLHHVFHVLLTGETDSYYEDFKNEPLTQLGKCLTEGFAFQGSPSSHRKGALRGEKSAHLPPQAFISFLQNHDQIGNRALGERLAALTDKEKLALGMSILLLSPQPPMLFMGEEWATTTPFLYFCDFEGELAGQVTDGRRNEFKSFAGFADPAMRDRIPDPNAKTTFYSSKLVWGDLSTEKCCAHLSFTTTMLALRHRFVVPLLKSGWIESRANAHSSALDVFWKFNGGTLRMLANFSDQEIPNLSPHGDVHIWGATGSSLPPWESTWYVTEGAAHD